MNSKFRSQPESLSRQHSDRLSGLNTDQSDQLIHNLIRYALYSKQVEGFSKHTTIEGSIDQLLRRTSPHVRSRATETATHHYSARAIGSSDVFGVQEFLQNRVV